MRVFILLLASVLFVAGCGGDPTPTAPPTATVLPTPTALVTNSLADGVLQAGPGPDFDQVVQVSEGTQVNVIGSARGQNCWDWVLVRTAEGDEGWIMPVLVGIDIRAADLPVVPPPTPVAPLPAACGPDLALVQINNRFGMSLDVYMAGAEPGFSRSIDSGSTELLCLTPGEYCYDMTDGDEHERGSLFFPAGQCTCWHWGGAPPQSGSCPCSKDPGDYARP
jgi:hypothetical protein